MSEQVENTQGRSLLVSIVNYKVAELTVTCLQSLEQEVKLNPGIKVLVVDNDSGDQSIEVIQAAIVKNNWQAWASVVESGCNGGYSYGNNIAIRPAISSDTPPDYFLILNPDTQIRQGALGYLMDFMQANPKAGACGPSVEDVNGNLLSIAFRFPSILSEFESSLSFGLVSKLLSRWVVARKMPNVECVADWIPGTAMLVRREVFNDIGLMDEGYFLFYEETDLCLQAKRAGWSTWYVPQARIMDLIGQSRQKSASLKESRKPQYWFDSRRRYFLKNHGLFYTACADCMWIIGFTLFRLRTLVQKRLNFGPVKFLGDFIRNSVFVRGGLGK